MLKKSHKLLGEYLLSCQSLPEPVFEKAFLWGCVEPDYNCFTYLRGSLRIQPLRGHNYPNALPCILRIAQRLQKSSSWGMWNYYCLGKLIHYVSDAFTYPHNLHYGSSLKGHLSYEENLHNCLRSGRLNPSEILREDWSRPAGAVILGAHRQYAGISTDPSTDLGYILAVTAAVFRQLAPDAANTGTRPWEVCEGSGYEELVYAGYPAV